MWRSGSCRRTAASSFQSSSADRSRWSRLLHIAAAWRERESAQEHDGWLVVGPPDSIPEKKARIVVAPDGERIAVFRDGNQIGALTNLCAHQNGPLGEGCIVNGLVTCPWHGYEYRLEDGCAPPPFTEKLATYRVRLRDGIDRGRSARAAAGDQGGDQNRLRITQAGRFPTRCGMLHAHP